MNKISVIIPVYNVEKYLDRCLESVVNQTYKNLEIILVDDGSPDNSPRMCDEWAEKDSRIKVIHKKNGGLSDARNVGVDNASGDWIYFIDSDDYIDLKTFEIMINAAINNDCDMAVAMYDNVVKDVVWHNDFGSKIDVMTSANYVKEYYDNVFNKQFLLGSCQIIACNKLMKKSIAKEFPFPAGKLHEDEFTTYKLCYKCKKIAVVREALYFYIRHDSSITITKKTKTNFVYLDALKERFQFFKCNKEDELMQLALIHLMTTLIEFYCIALDELNDKLIAKEIVADFKTYFKMAQTYKNNEYYKKNKNKFLFFNFSASLFKLLKNIKKKIKL